MKKLAIITTHPIQYYAPVFKLLNERQAISIKVFFTWGEHSVTKYDPGFNRKIEWDIPLLEGYPYEWAKNTSKDPGTHHFTGIINPEITSQVNAWQPDAILIYGWGFQSHLKVIQHYKNKIPVLFRGDSTLLDEKNGARYFLKSVFLKWIYKHVDYAFYVGANNKAYFKKYGLTHDRLKFAPHAVDNNRFAREHKHERAFLRREEGIKNDELIILFAGKLEAKKDPALLLEAFTNLNKPAAHLLFVGNGPLEESLKRKAKGNHSVHFMDFQNQSQMPAVYQACDLFCLPSKGPGETWGMAVNEAMAAGKAILSADRVGAAADLVKPGENGAIFRAGDLADLMRHLDALIEAGKNELQKMGARSKEFIKDWNFENQVKVIESIVING